MRASVGQHSQQQGADAPPASQTPPLNLTFPKSAEPHHRATVQSNEVYPTPPAPVRPADFGGASDKRLRSETLDLFNHAMLDKAED